MIDGHFEATENGVPQGARLSPLLANVYLHSVLDRWFDRDVKPRLTGEAYLIRFSPHPMRYADDKAIEAEPRKAWLEVEEAWRKRGGTESMERVGGLVSVCSANRRVGAVGWEFR